LKRERKVLNEEGAQFAVKISLAKTKTDFIMLFIIRQCKKAAQQVLYFLTGVMMEGFK